jgi:hypothetical protein
MARPQLGQRGAAGGPGVSFVNVLKSNFMAAFSTGACASANHSSGTAL